MEMSSSIPYSAITLAAEETPAPLWAIVLAASIGIAAVAAGLVWVRRRGPGSSNAPAAGEAGPPTAPNSGGPGHVGPYRVHRRLGVGGMGTVSLATSPGGRTVAVKVAHPELAGDTEFRRRFTIEVEAARRVGGFYTAQVVDADPDGDPPWLATAYIAGPTLLEAVRSHGPLPAASTAALGAGLAEGLAAVHAAGVVHRDLKPGNIIVAADGPRLIDFGIARALDAAAATRTSAVLGTAAYMAPEQVTGGGIGPPCDVFALGCVLVFAATGRSPFGEGPSHAITHRIVHGEPDLSGVPQPLAELVVTCLAKDPRDRPTVERVLQRLAAEPPGSRDDARPQPWLPDDLTEEIAARAADAEEATGPQNSPAALQQSGLFPPTRLEDRAQPPRSRTRRFAWAGGVLGTAVLLAAALIAWDTSPRPELTLDDHDGTVQGVAFSPDSAVLATGAEGGVQLWDSQTGERLHTMEAPGVQSVSFSPSGDRIAAGCRHSVCIWDTGSGELVEELSGHEGAVHDAAFSAEGGLLASASQDTTARIWDAETGEHLDTVGTPSNANAVAFDPSGAMYVVAGSTDISLWDFGVGQRIYKFGAHDDSVVHAVAYSPEGTTFSSGDADGTVLVWDAQTNERHLTLKGHTSTVNSMAYTPDGSLLATAGNDRTVRLWDTGTGEALAAIEGHGAPVHAVAISADGATLASAGQDGAARVWNLQELLADAR